MGIQSELKTIRKEVGTFQEQPAEEQTGQMSQIADAVGDALNAVESTVVGAAQSMVPSWDMIQGVMPSAGMSVAPVIDLTLPTAASSKKA